MNNHKIQSRHLYVWLMVAMTAPLAAAAGTNDWMTTGVVGILCGILCWTVIEISGEGIRWNRWMAAAQWIWLIVVLAGVVSYSKEIWTDAGYGNMIPVTLLALAAWSAQGGIRRSSVVGSVLIWFVMLLYAFIFAAGIKDVEIRWLEPKLQQPSAGLIFAFLLPAVTIMIPHESTKKHVIVLASAVIFGGVCAALVSGVLSQQVASTIDDPFYEMSRSLSLSGVARRFESLVSCVITFGWYEVISLLLSAAVEMAKIMIPKLGKWAGWGSAAIAAAVHLCGMSINDTFLAFGSLIFWGFTPILTQGIERIKKS